MAKTLYFNIEDDLKAVVARSRQEAAAELHLVFPRRCYLFADPVNLKLLKKQLEVLGKQATIATMDERGKEAAVAAGFALGEVVQRRIFGRGMAGDIQAPRQRQRGHATVRGEAAEVLTSPSSASLAKVVSKPSVAAADKVAKVVTGHVTSGAATTAKQTLHDVQVRDTIFSDMPSASSFRSGLSQPPAHRLGGQRLVWIATALLVLLAVSVVYFYLLPTATVQVYAKGEAVTRDMEINMSVETPRSDVDSLTLTANRFETPFELQDKFEAAGKKEVGSFASGKVRIFNLTGNSINLRASTTTLAAEGRQFVFKLNQNYIKNLTPKAATSPAAGHLAEVVASEAGEASNLKAGTRLKLTNKVFGSNPEQLYALVDEDLVGGNSRFISEITAEDLAKAENELRLRMLEQTLSEMKKQGKYVPESAYTIDLTESGADKAAGAESSVFNYRYKGVIKGLAFDAAALTELARARVTKTLAAGSQLQPAGKDKISFKLRQADLSSGSMKISLHFESQIRKELSVNNLPSELAGSSRNQADERLKKHESISRFEISIWPSWRMQMPALSSRIRVSVAAD